MLMALFHSKSSFAPTRLQTWVIEGWSKQMTKCFNYSKFSYAVMLFIHLFFSFKKYLSCA